MSSLLTARVLALRFALLAVILLSIVAAAARRLSIDAGQLAQTASDGVPFTSVLVALLILGLTAVATAPPLRSLLESGDAGLLALVIRLHLIAIHVALIALLTMIAAKPLLLAQGAATRSVGCLLLAVAWAAILQACFIALWLVRNTSRLVIHVD